LSSTQVDAPRHAKPLLALLHSGRAVEAGLFGALGFDGERLGDGGGRVEARDVAAHVLGAHLCANQPLVWDVPTKL
jgi:hypothetical protein